MDSSLLKQYLTGTVEGMVMDENFLFMAGILMEIPILMILLSLILTDKPNAWCNIMSSSIKTIVMVATLFVGTPTKYYMFFAAIEISTTIFIFVYAVRWLREIKKTT